ncbi:LysR family transcriptional regulator [Pseudomonas aeruginosa]|nr:LysR family transcriptional regulator [Pseudomonas aeruginosa]
MDPSLLPALASFAHIAYHRSFTKAAAEMGVSRAALSQSLKALERQLNVRLLYRTTRDMSLTEEGQRLYEAIYPTLGTIERAVRNLGETHLVPSGLLRVNTSRVAAKTLLEPYLAEFLGRYPQLKLELVMDDGLSNIIADGCDAGIRLGESLASHVVAVPITPMLEMAVVGSPAYFERYGKPETPAELVQHNCLSYRSTGSGAIYRWEFSSPETEGHTFAVEPQGGFITNDDDGMIRAALQGVGLMQHMNLAVRQYLADGSLIRVLQPWCSSFPGFYLYVPSREQMPTKVRALMDFLTEKRDSWNQV